MDAKRRPGRPQKGDAPLVPYETIDRLLVFGEEVPSSDGVSVRIVYPSYRELAARYHVSPSLIAHYAKTHQCLRRREAVKARAIERSDRKLAELRATTIAISRDDSIRMIDSYLAHFEKALAEGRVRADNPTDFNTMVRLKEFVLAGAEGRHDIDGISLEEIQARHARVLREFQEANGPERGMVEPGADHALTVQAYPIVEAFPDDEQN